MGGERVRASGGWEGLPQAGQKKKKKNAVRLTYICANTMHACPFGPDLACLALAWFGVCWYDKRRQK